MRRRRRVSKAFPGDSRQLVYASIVACTLTIALLATACAGSTPPAPTEPTPQVTATPVAAASAAASTEVPPSKYLRFNRLTAEDVLSGDHTRNVVQDRHGLMWIGTLNGLNRFDGTGVKLYRHDPDNPNSLSNNVARALVVDQNGVLWIGTWGGGLNQQVLIDIIPDLELVIGPQSEVPQLGGIRMSTPPPPTCLWTWTLN